LNGRGVGQGKGELREVRLAGRGGCEGVKAGVHELLYYSGERKERDRKRVVFLCHTALNGLSKENVRHSTHGFGTKLEH